MGSPQTLSEADRRMVALWAADCAERVLPLFEAEAPTVGRPADAIARARAFGRGELDAADQIRQRFVAGRAAGVVSAADAEISWRLEHLTQPVRAALRRLPLLGEDPAGPLGSGLLASGVLGSIIRQLQAGLTERG